MNKVYIITETVYNNGGHGMGNDEEQALVYYCDPVTKKYKYPPAFTERHKALEFARENDMAFVRIVELSLQ
jgi:hypothetical protein